MSVLANHMLNPEIGVGGGSHLSCAAALQDDKFDLFWTHGGLSSSAMPRGCLHCLWPSGHVHAEDAEGCNKL